MIGRTVSHYKILEHLGEGGMGVVYKAHDARLDRTVALKFLPENITAGEVERERFYQEARAAAALNHPNVCTIHDISEHDGSPFIVMEYVDGETLRHKIRQKLPSLKESVEYAIQIAEALKAAHEKEIVHRDIKSENIMITSRGQIKVMDFGLAKLKGSLKLTKPSSTVGTLAYMAPEQIQGKEVDARSDIFSFGVVLFEMLTGHLPFSGEYESAMMYAILNEEPASPQSFRPDVPEKLSDVISKALEKDPDLRYQAVKGMLADFKRLKRDSGKVQHSTPVEPVQPPKEEAAVERVAEKKHPTPPKKRWQWISASIVTALALVTVFYIVFRDDLPPAPATSSTSPVSSTETRLVVLPFDNLGPPGDEYFADGMANQISDRLSAVYGLGVISRTSAVQYKNSGKTIRQIGDELGVDYVLEGDVQWERNTQGESRIRITPRLIRVSDDNQIWQTRYDEVFEDIFTVQARVADDVAKQLDLTLLEAQDTVLTDNLEAYDHYLRGIDFYSHGLSGGWDAQEFDRAERSFQMAIDLDPGFVMAHVHLCLALAFQYHLGYDRFSESLTRARDAAAVALRLKPDLPEAQGAMAYYYFFGMRDNERALEILESIREERPNFSTNVIARIQRSQGKWEQAVTTFEEASTLDPRNSYLAYQLGDTYRRMRRYEDADNWFHRSLTIEPGNAAAQFGQAFNTFQWKGDINTTLAILEALPSSQTVDYFIIWMLLFDRNYDEALKRINAFRDDSFEFLWYYFQKNLLRAEVYYFQKEYERQQVHADSARTALEEAVRAQPENPARHAALGLAYAYLNEREKALEEGGRAVELLPVTKDAFVGTGYLLNLTALYALVGEHESAIDQLDDLLSNPSEISVLSVRLNRAWDVLRDHPGFQQLLEKHSEPDS